MIQTLITTSFMLLISTQVGHKPTDAINPSQYKPIDPRLTSNLTKPDPTSPKSGPNRQGVPRTIHRWPAILESYRSCDNPMLALSIIEVESNFINQIALTEDSTGLMQIRPSTAKGLDCLAKTQTQLLNIHLNIRCGCKYLRQLKSRYPNLKDQIASYNAGAVKKCYTGKLYPSGKSCPIGGYINQSYVDKVMSIMETKYGHSSRIVQKRRRRMLYALQ